MTDCLLTIDQGTTSSRAIVFDISGNIIALAQQEFPQIYPADGWVEHNPEDIWSSSLEVTRQAMEQAEAAGTKIIALGITNQRETTVIWDRETGNPIYNAIVWQDRRTADTCDQLRKQYGETEVQARSGLLLDPYFSATKVAWILDHVDGARELAESGKLAFGTIDSFLISRLTGGKRHVTDITNASRTNLFNIHQQRWDPELLSLFNVPSQILPEVLECADNFGTTDAKLLNRPLPILGVAGDQQAATIGQCCFKPGDIKSTYGTGCFVLTNTGEQPVTSKNRLLTTVAYRIGGRTHYALEGSIFIAGAAVQWLRDGLGIIQSAQQTETLVQQTENNAGIYLVPAFTGLGAPYWDAEARGAIFGLTRSTGPKEITRAALESVCYQTGDLLTAMQQDGIRPAGIKVDGGMVANNWLMQFLADILDINVARPKVMETTALGAAYLAGLQAEVYKNTEDLTNHWQQEQLFQPNMPNEQRTQLLNNWKKAVSRVLSS